MVSTSLNRKGSRSGSRPTVPALDRANPNANDEEYDIVAEAEAITAEAARLVLV